MGATKRISIVAKVPGAATASTARVFVDDNVVSGDSAQAADRCPNVVGDDLPAGVTTGNQGRRKAELH